MLVGVRVCVCVSAAVTLPGLVGVALPAGWSRPGSHTPATDQARRGAA